MGVWVGGGGVGGSVQTLRVCFDLCVSTDRETCCRRSVHT